MYSHQVLTSLTDDIFEYQIPSDHERDEFAHADVTVNVGRPGPRYSRREFGITQACGYNK